MKIIFVTLTIILTINLHAQKPTQECISERRISIKVTPEIKLKLKKNGDLISFIKSAAAKDELAINRVSADAFMPIVPMNYIYNSKYELIDSIGIADYFRVLEPASMPLVHDSGEPVTRKNASGALEYVYPAPEVLELNVDLLSEIRIREVRIENQKEFMPLEIGFYTSSVYMGNEPFWVNVNDLYELQNDKTFISGHDFFMNKEYQGFQYRQKECGK